MAKPNALRKEWQKKKPGNRGTGLFLLCVCEWIAYKLSFVNSLYNAYIRFSSGGRKKVATCTVDGCVVRERILLEEKELWTHVRDMYKRN